MKLIKNMGYNLRRIIDAFKPEIKLPGTDNLVPPRSDEELFRNIVSKLSTDFYLSRGKYVTKEQHDKTWKELCLYRFSRVLPINS